MEQKLRRTPVLILTVLLAAAAFLLRRNQLKTAFDEIGVIAGKGGLFIWVTAVVILLFALYAFFLRGRKKYNAISSRNVVPAVLSCAAALLMIAGSVARLLSVQQKSDWIIAVGGLLAAACWVGVAAARFRAKRAHVALFLVPTVFYVVELVCQFRLWTRDPIILDYFYDLGALICIMCALFHLGGYCFDLGGRRITVFFSLSGIFFGAAAMAGAPGGDPLRYLAAIFWLLANLWLLLRPAGSRAKTNEEKE